ncbi:MAG: RNA polymerase sigma factor [Candidatus Omnitrophica bacterium]|nr:RNA polymerase sigma factor [Candidatus Omnitrophota bacterium]
MAVAVDSTLSDLDLVRQVQEQDDLKAYEVLVKRYEKEAFGLAYTLVGSREDAKDVLQECFFNLYLSLKNFRGESSFRTYFFRVLVNRCRDEQRKKSVWGRIILRTVPMTEEEEESLEGVTLKTPSEELAQTELGQKIEEAMKGLPWRQRTVFALKMIDGMKIREIAELTELTPGAVKANIFHAISKMRSVLQDYLELSKG